MPVTGIGGEATTMMTPLSLARAIYEHHRRKSKGPRWEELPERQRQDRVWAAGRLQAAYERKMPRESRVTG